MNATDFLKLVSEMRKEQKLYFATRREFAREKQEHLIASKGLEKQVDRVVAEGMLEPDAPTVSIINDGVQIGMFMTDEELQEQRALRYDNEIDAGNLLDTSAE
jgi:hypothetical protein